MVAREATKTKSTTSLLDNILELVTYRLALKTLHRAIAKQPENKVIKHLAPQRGLEPRTSRLTAGRSTD